MSFMVFVDSNLVAAMSAKVWPAQRRQLAGVAVDTIFCGRCQQADETMQHVVWGCPKNEGEVSP